MTLASMHFAAPMKLVPQSERINLTSPRKATKRCKALMKLDEDISLMISISMARMTKQVKITAHLFD
jgi:hypothetical protein